MALTFDDIRAVVEAHQERVRHHRPYVKRHRSAYACRILQSQTDDATATFVRRSPVVVEPPDAFGFIESYVASLFVKAPAVQSSSSVDGQGEHDSAAKLVNAWLPSQAGTFKAGIRNAFVDPFAGWKMSWSPAREQPAPMGRPKPEKAQFDPVDGIQLTPLSWDEMIIDVDAKRWKDQRYVGHTYVIDVEEAKRKFKGKKWKGTDDQTDTLEAGRVVRSAGDLMMVRIYEVYDLINDEMICWSDDAVKSDGVLKREEIPFDDGYGRKMVPIIPMYFLHASGEHADQPLRGWSSIARQYSLYKETASLRTTQAGDVRRNARLLAARKGRFDGDTADFFQRNEDGSVLEVQLPPGQAVSTAFAPIPQPQSNPDNDRYEAKVQSDLDRGSVLAPFTRGQATRGTATEAALLSEYTATEIGNLAHSRDLAIVQCAQMYLAMVRWALESGAIDVLMIEVDGQPTVINRDVLVGKFRFQPADSTTTPISRALRKTEVITLSPLLMQLGADPQAIAKYIIELYDLPSSFIPAEQPDPGPSTQAAAEEQPPTPIEEATTVPVGGGQVAATLRGGAGV